MLNIASSFLNNIYPAKNYNELCNPEILNISSSLNAIFSKNHNINVEIPQLVVVGSQSSGKSSLLNNIINMDILPTGKNMVTRMPLNIQLFQTEDNQRLEFGMYTNGFWKTSSSINLTENTIQPQISESIKEMIIQQTNKIIGNNKNISHEQLVIKIYSKNVPNLSLVDLPGLTMVACTDQGQPKDIKQQIIKLVSSYIKSERSIILAVIPARTDIEADPAMELVKEYDPNGDRTIGVLTKVDLMNKGTDISDYLNNNISIDLQTKYGYYAVRNLTNSELQNEENSRTVENDFFQNHPIYSKLSNTKKLGISNLSSRLSDILVTHIRSHMPKVISEIDKMYTEIEHDLHDLGSSIPSTTEEKLSFVHHIISNICQKYSKSINDKISDLNTGRKIKEEFITYRHHIYNLHPFDDCNENYLVECIKNCEGNHMSFFTPPIEVLEHCLQDSQINPFESLVLPSHNCLQNISNILQSLIDHILKSKKLSRFPKLVNHLLLSIDKNVINFHLDITKKKINEMIEMEKNYIWTDDLSFHESLKQTMSSKNKICPQKMKNLLDCYFSCNVKVIQNNIPKLIMLFFVKSTQKSIKHIFNEISNSNVDSLLQEESDIEKKRKILIEKKQKLNEARKILEKYN